MISYGKPAMSMPLLSDVRADQKPNITFLKRLKVSPSFFLVAHPSQHDTRVRILLTRLHLAAPAAWIAAQTVQVQFQVVAVYVGAAEAEALCHLKRVSNFLHHLEFLLLYFL